jgi:hypothetical protein
VPREASEADELARWAASRAPELLARAEAEAVALLRDALVEAAREQTRPESRRPRPAAEPPPARVSDDDGELIWAYCVVRAGDRRPAELHGVDPGFAVEPVEAAGLVALVSRVPRSGFAAEPLRQNLNDISWLERVARAHEVVLEETLAAATLVPLRLCTLFEDFEGVRRMLGNERDKLTAALDALDGRQEWGVKVLVDPERLEEQARARVGDATAAGDEAAGAGGAYMRRRRIDRQVREAAHALMSELAEDVRATLEHSALDVVTRPPQNRELSGYEGEMLVNAACLIDSARVDALRALVGELEARHHGLGARVELTGPWPPYNFVPHGGAPMLA